MSSTVPVHPETAALSLASGTVVRMWEALFIGTWIGLLAAILTSFAMAVGGRTATGESWTSRSHCSCGADLSALALVPVAGWLLRGGRARCCGAAIPWRFPAAEAGSALLAIASCVAAGPTAALVVTAVVVVAAGVSEFRRARS